MGMEAEYVNPFLEATVSVLKTMASLEVVPGKPFIKKESSACGDVSGIVGITGETEGSLCITFSRGCILQVVSTWFGEEAKEINDEVKDAVGELTNMISGDSGGGSRKRATPFTGRFPRSFPVPDTRLSISPGSHPGHPFQPERNGFFRRSLFQIGKRREGEEILFSHPGLSHPAEMTDADFGKISRLVYEVCGINLTEGKKELLKARLGKVIRQGAFPSFRDYYEHVVRDSSGEELVRLLDAVSTNFTSFFRESQHFDYLRNEFLPEAVDRKKGQGKRLRFWSAGCSSGEETLFPRHRRTGEPGLPGDLGPEDPLHRPLQQGAEDGGGRHLSPGENWLGAGAGGAEIFSKGGKRMERVCES